MMPVEQDTDALHVAVPNREHDRLIRLRFHYEKRLIVHPASGTDPAFQPPGYFRCHACRSASFRRSYRKTGHPQKGYRKIHCGIALPPVWIDFAPLFRTAPD